MIYLVDSQADVDSIAGPKQVVWRQGGFTVRTSYDIYESPAAQPIAVLETLYNDPRNFGAISDGVADCSGSFESTAIAGTVAITDGQYKLVSKTTYAYTFGNNDALPVHEGVRLVSGSEYRGDSSAVLKVHGFSGQPVPHINASFGTGKPATMSLSNITLSNLVFDFDPGGNFGQNHRGPYMVGVSGVHYNGLRGKSSGSRSGYFSHLQNCKNIVIDDFQTVNVTGGINFSYCSDVKLTNLRFENFSEAIDFDRLTSRVQGENWSFSGAQNTSQCVDLNSVEMATIRGVSAKDVGNILTINYKDTSPPTFTDYVNNVTPVALTPSRDITILAIRGEDCGSATNPSIVIGNDWSGIPHAGYPASSNIKIQDASLLRVGQFRVRECLDLLIDGVSMDTVYVPGDGTAAMDLSSETADANQLLWSDLTAIVRDVKISRSQRGGFRASTPRRLVIDGLEVIESNTLGGSANDVDFVSLDVRSAHVEITRLIAPTVRIGGSGSGYAVLWGAGNVVGALSFSGSGNLRTYGRTVQQNIDNIAATGTVNRLLYVAPRKCYVTFAEFTPLSVIAADASNARSITLRVTKGGVDASMASYSLAAGLAASETVQVAPSINNDATLLNAGDTVRIVLSSTGAGKAIESAMIKLNVIDVG